MRSSDATHIIEDLIMKSRQTTNDTLQGCQNRPISKPTGVKRVKGTLPYRSTGVIVLEGTVCARLEVAAWL